MYHLGYARLNLTSCSNLPALVAVISLAFNLLFAALCTYLPDEPYYIWQIVSVYAWAGCAFSLCGCVGVAMVREYDAAFYYQLRLRVPRNKQF